MVAHLYLGSGPFFTACAPHRVIPGTTSIDHGRDLLATKGAGQCPLLVERWKSRRCETRVINTVAVPTPWTTGQAKAYVASLTMLRPLRWLGVMSLFYRPIPPRTRLSKSYINTAPASNPPSVFPLISRAHRQQPKRPISRRISLAPSQLMSHLVLPVRVHFSYYHSSLTM